MPTTFRFAPNVPATVEIKYIDIVPSEKGGPQIRLKGTIDGTEKSIAYLPGKLNDQLAVLIHHGVIPNAAYPSDVTDPLEVKPVKRQFTMMKEQGAGDKYGKFAIVGQNGNGGSSATIGSTVGQRNEVQAASPHKPCGQLYAESTDYVIKQILPKYQEAKLQFDTALVVEMVGQLFNAKVREA